MRVSVIDSAIRDAADHLMSFEAGAIGSSYAIHGRRLEFYIVTKDHVGEATCAALRGIGHTAWHTPTVPELSE